MVVLNHASVMRMTTRKSDNWRVWLLVLFTQRTHAERKARLTAKTSAFVAAIQYLATKFPARSNCARLATKSSTLSVVLALDFARHCTNAARLAALESTSGDVLANVCLADILAGRAIVKIVAH